MTFLRLKGEKQCLYFHIYIFVPTLLVHNRFVLKRNPRAKASRFRNTKLADIVQSADKLERLPMLLTAELQRRCKILSHLVEGKLHERRISAGKEI